MPLAPGEDTHALSWVISSDRLSGLEGGLVGQHLRPLSIREEFGGKSPYGMANVCWKPFSNSG
jgi:hypothetical protein